MSILNGFLSITDTVRGRSSGLEQRSIGNYKTEINTAEKKEQNRQKLWKNLKLCSICILRISEREDRMEQMKYLK